VKIKIIGNASREERYTVAFLIARALTDHAIDFSIVDGTVALNPDKFLLRRLKQNVLSKLLWGDSISISMARRVKKVG